MIKNETDMVLECRNYLAKNHYNDLWVWRNNTGALRTPSGGFISFGYPGSPDLIGMDNTGRFIGLEGKTIDGKQSEKQKIFQANTESMRGLYSTYTSLEDLLFKLQRYKIIS